ncbi:hypothetical protein ACMFMG_011138 [Clarireedia jacksonii]
MPTSYKSSTMPNFRPSPRMLENAGDLASDPFLDESSSERLLGELKDDTTSKFDTKAQSYLRRQGRCRGVVIHSMIFLTYTIVLLVANTLFTHRLRAPAIVYTPAQNALRYEKVFYNGSLDAINEFKGDPRPELDRAWHDVLKNNNIRLTKDELHNLNKSSIELADGSGYFGQLNVYHHLHCLKFIREVFYSEYYPEARGPTTKSHVDHCIDDIRQALMCQADTSITSYRWEAGARRPTPDFIGYVRVSPISFQSVI